MQSDKYTRRSRVGIIALIPISLAVMALGVSIGSTWISPFDTVRAVFCGLFSLDMPPDISASTAAIILELRLPRVALAFLTGACLSVGGAVTQSVLSNPLASPYTLGVSSGASVGAALAVVFGVGYGILGNMTLAVIGMIFASLTVVICVAMSTALDKNLGSTTIVLFGMVLSLFLTALFSFTARLSKDKMTFLIRWQTGSFASKGHEANITLFIIFVVCFLGIMLKSGELDILSFGDETALGVGVNVKKEKWLLLILTAVLAGAAVSFSGVIGFIDLIAPHIARKLFSPKHKYLLPISAMAGGSFMVLADLVARSVLPGTELPVGSVTALIGAPFFAYIYFARRKTDA